MLIQNLAQFGVLADTVEVVIAVAFMLLGIWLTYRIQKWADRSGDAPAAANQALGGSADRYEPRGMRE
ncbi:MAG: hypothetical protein ACKOCK_07380 [Chloroflexota bacterium]